MEKFKQGDKVRFCRWEFEVLGPINVGQYAGSVAVWDGRTADSITFVQKNFLEKIDD